MWMSAQKDARAISSVPDNGHPIPPDELEHPFDVYQLERIPDRPPQYTRNLGLPVAAKVVQLHGGKIEIKSSSESGTTMEVSLPAFAAAVALVSAPVAPRAGSILLVEDDVDCREVLQQVLDQEGYRVAAVADTGAAISILQKSRPAMVLLDLRLSREDGRSVLHYIRESASLSDVPVYIISGTSEVSWTGSGGGLERIDGFFEKPVNRPTPLGTIAAVGRRRVE